MSGGKAAKRKRQRAWRQAYVNRTIDRIASVCPNCGQPGPHFAPPSGGGRFPGFFVCKPEVEA